MRGPTYALRQVHHVLTAEPDAELALSGDERERWKARRRSVDRDAFLAARVLTRTLVGRALCVDADGVNFGQSCASCGGPHGRPSVVGHDTCHVSWSHDGVWVAAGVSPTGCGIDVVDVHGLPAQLPWSALTSRERAHCEVTVSPRVAFARLWARKEALVKVGAIGIGDMRDVDVLDPSARRRGETGERIVLVDVGSADDAAVGAWARVLSPGEETS